MSLVLALLFASPALAGQPLAYREALTAAAERNAAALRAGYAASRAEADETRARGAFDPVYTLAGTYGFFAFDDVQDALPISGDERSWDLTTSLGATTSTGTTWSLATGLGFDRANAAGLQPIYDATGAQIGTAPFEASISTYSSRFAATVSQELLRGVRPLHNLAAVALARQQRTAAELAAESARQQALADAAVAYWTWVRMDQIQAVDQAAVDSAVEALRVARAQVDARTLAPIEASRLETARAVAEAMAVDSAVLARQARDQLLVVMGELPGRDVAPADEPGDPPRGAVDLERVVEAALAGNPDLGLARTLVDTSELSLTVARHARLPTLTAIASAGRTAGAKPTLTDAATSLVGDRGHPNLSLGGVLSVSLGNRIAAGAQRAAELDRQVAESALDELERQLRAQVRHQVASLDAARERAALADAAVASALATLAATEAMVVANRALPKDVLEARVALDRARVSAISARVDWRLAQTELLRLQGGMRPTSP